MADQHQSTHFTPLPLYEKIKQSFLERLQNLQAQQQGSNGNISGDTPEFNPPKILAIPSETGITFLQTNLQELVTVINQVVNEVRSYRRDQLQEVLETIARAEALNPDGNCNVCHQPLLLCMIRNECSVTLETD